MHKVLKPFPYSHDGIKTEQLAEGVQRDFRPDLVEGLEKAGLIGPPDAKGAAKGSKPAGEG
ncbi:hypothetical protein AZL_008370 [Azospirillum sp. B510]|uniref:hypothetical protein n=1 Tax=Azospirillum sp. (strain B510) TaxID=137722 RepID=UPI0001C4C35A|nr:hypothetical protein [Azospirillum sp. B510]BAI71475.1 hypothetical protein AZL_008370 [Azospirillum sp. B510]